MLPTSLLELFFLGVQFSLVVEHHILILALNVVDFVFDLGCGLNDPFVFEAHRFNLELEFGLDLFENGDLSLQILFLGSSQLFLKLSTLGLQSLFLKLVFLDLRGDVFEHCFDLKQSVAIFFQTTELFQFFLEQLFFQLELLFEGLDLLSLSSQLLDVVLVLPDIFHSR